MSRVLNGNKLAIYLNDHLAGATGGLELAKRAQGSNADSSLGATLGQIAAEIDEDRETLLEVMRSAEVRRDPVKRLGALVAERAGRLKLNGQLTGYSPLSRLLELELLVLGVSGKLALWRSLAELGDPRLAAFDFAELARRARSQRDRLERARVRAAKEALRE
jgi:hypothetical protein